MTVASCGWCSSGAAAKYRCPKCDARTCSALCVNAHKEKTGCDGVRNRSRYIPVGEFTDLDLASDYRLLEGALAQVDKCRRDKLKRSTRQGNELYRPPPLPKGLKRLQDVAKTVGTQIRILPPHFNRRVANTSYYDAKNKVILWHLELNFLNIGQKVEFQRVPDSTPLWQIIQPYLDIDQLPQSFLCHEDSHEDQLDIDSSVSSKKVDPFLLYRSVGYGGIRLLLRCETLPPPGSPSRRYYAPLNLRKSLRANFANKTLVEHPVIHVILRGDECNYREDADCFDLLEVTDACTIKGEPGTAGTGGDAQDHPHGILPSPVFADEPEEESQVESEDYKHYYEFYLKYYTQKYANQQPVKDFSVPPPDWPEGRKPAGGLDRQRPHHQAATVRHQGPAKPSHAALNNDNKTAAEAIKAELSSRSSASATLPSASKSSMPTSSQDVQQPQDSKTSQSSGLGLLGGLVAYDDSDSD